MEERHGEKERKLSGKTLRERRNRQRRQRRQRETRLEEQTSFSIGASGVSYVHLFTFTFGGGVSGTFGIFSGTLVVHERQLTYTN
jgi:hypothetical protein